MKIEKGIPIPPKKTGKFKGLTEVLRKMKVGESAFFRGAIVTNMTSVAARVTDKTFTARTQDGGVRVWRTE